MSNNYISLMDQQLVHHLASIRDTAGKKLTQPEIADIVGISERSVRNILKKSLDDITSSINAVDYIEPLDSGCYRAAYYFDGDDGPICYQQEINHFSDPTFEQVSAWEEEE